MVYFKSILYLFYMLFYFNLFCIFSLFLRTILKELFIYFKPIILKQKTAKNSPDLCTQRFCKLALK